MHAPAAAFPDSLDRHLGINASELTNVLDQMKTPACERQEGHRERCIEGNRRCIEGNREREVIEGEREREVIEGEDEAAVGQRGNAGVTLLV